MSDLTLYNGDNAESSMVFYPDLTKDRLVGIFTYIVDKDKPDENNEEEFALSYNDCTYLRDFLTSVIDLYDKKHKGKKKKEKS